MYIKLCVFETVIRFVYNIDINEGYVNICRD